MNRFVVGLLMLSSVAYAANFDYEPTSPYGPYEWNTIFSDYCDAKQYPRQSPIDIKKGYLQYAPDLGDMKLKNFDSKGVMFQAENNGHSAQFNLLGSQMESEGGPVGDEDYKPLQLHFHWGNASGGPGSEHTVLGKQHMAEMHIVHANNKYLELNEPIGDIIKKEDGILVIAVFIDVAGPMGKRRPNEEFAKIAEGTLKVNARAGSKYNMTKGYVNLSKLLPDRQSEYYTYPGGLTTPHCNGVVTWVIFKHAISVKKEHLGAFFTQIDHYGKPIKNNFRPIQPLNRRIVRTTSMDDGMVISAAAGGIQATFALIMTAIFSRIFL